MTTHEVHTFSDMATHAEHTFSNMAIHVVHSFSDMEMYVVYIHFRHGDACCTLIFQHKQDFMHRVFNNFYLIFLVEVLLFIKHNGNIKHKVFVEVSPNWDYPNNSLKTE